MADKVRHLQRANMHHHIKAVRRFGQGRIGQRQFDVDIGVLLLEIGNDGCHVASPKPQRRIHLERADQAAPARVQIL